MAYAQAKAFDQSAIPVVDITPLRDGSNPQQVADALSAASRNPGFIYIRGHGIPDDLINAARQQALAFFRQSDDLKSEVLISAKHRGWLKPGAAKMQDDAKVDLKESFIWGYQDTEGKTPEDHPLRGSNQWPDSLPNLQTAAMAYYEQAQRLAMELLQGFALGLGLDKGFFLQHCERPLTRSAFVYYPSQPESMGEKQFGVAPHTDFGVLTVLCQDDVGGLQVQTADGEWVHAPPIEGTLVVNVGDLLARWTDDVYLSTPHRVVNNSGRERLSLVLAFDPDPETQIDPAGLFGADHQPKQAAISCGDYLIWRFGKAFSYRS